MLLANRAWTACVQVPIHECPNANEVEWFQICDVDVATGEVRRHGGHPVEVLKAQGLQGMRPLLRRTETCRNQ